MSGEWSYGVIALALLALGVGSFLGSLVFYHLSRKSLVTAVQYLVERLRKSETDIVKLAEELTVLREHVRRKDLLEDEDFAALRREMVDLPRKHEAEKRALAKDGLEPSKLERLVKTPSTSVH
jgi:hypothetical protein